MNHKPLSRGRGSRFSAPSRCASRAVFPRRRDAYVEKQDGFPKSSPIKQKAAGKPAAFIVFRHGKTGHPMVDQCGGVSFQKRYCTEQLFYMQREVFVWYSDKSPCALNGALFWHCLLNGLPYPSAHNRCSSPDALSAAFRTGCIGTAHSAAG